MPSFRVLKKCFRDGAVYDPNGKRPVYHCAKNPFGKKIPDCFEPIKETSSDAAKKAAEEKKALKEAQRLAEEQKRLEDEAALFNSDKGKAAGAGEGAVTTL